MTGTALTILRNRRMPLRLVIFDCDGVLIDSEPVADRVVAAELAAVGWVASPAEVHERFLGMCTADMPPLIEAVLGHKLSENWAAQLADHLVAAMAREAVMMPGAAEALDAADALGIDWRIASNSGPQELAAKFVATGLTERVAGRVLSATDIVARADAASRHRISSWRRPPMQSARPKPASWSRIPCLACKAPSRPAFSALGSMSRVLEHISPPKVRSRLARCRTCRHCCGQR